MQLTKLIPFIIAGGAMAAGSYAFLSSSIPYVTAGEAVARPGQQVHVAGQIVKGSANLDVRSGVLQFDIIDDASKPMHVVYRGSKPANFDTAPKVSVAGCYKDGTFIADQILVKCPSKYESKAPA